jgi:hypothetical protein
LAVFATLPVTIGDKVERFGSSRATSSSLPSTRTQANEREKERERERERERSPRR